MWGLPMEITYGDYHGLLILWRVCLRNIRITYPFKMSTLQRQLVWHVTCFLVVVPNRMWDLKFWGFPKSSEINLQKNHTFEKRNPAPVDMAVNIPWFTGFHTSQIIPSGAGFLPSTVSCLLTFLFVKTHMLKQFWSSARFPRKNGVECRKSSWTRTRLPRLSRRGNRAMDSSQEVCRPLSCGSLTSYPPVN